VLLIHLKGMTARARAAETRSDGPPPMHHLGSGQVG